MGFIVGCERKALEVPVVVVVACVWVFGGGEAWNFVGAMTVRWFVGRKADR